jgi:hypothetical protein
MDTKWFAGVEAVVYVKSGNESIIRISKQGG